MNQNHTNLKQIKGIGEAREKWLKDVLDIKSLQDLSQMSAETIEAHIKAEGLIVSREAIDKWIKQAQSLITGETALHHADSAKLDAQEMMPNWIPYASFVIEYQARMLPTGNKDYRTTAHFMETDRSKSWSGTVTTEVADWILAQTEAKTVAPTDLVMDQPNSDAALAPSEIPPKETEKLEAYPSSEIGDSVTITQIRAFQPASSMLLAGSGKSGQPFLGTLKSEQPFALEASLEIEDLPADLEANQVPLLMQFYAFNKATENTIFLGNTEINQFDLHQPAQKTLLSRVQLAKGLYRLRVHATIQSNPPLKGYLEVPFMQVQ